MCTEAGVTDWLTLSSGAAATGSTRDLLRLYTEASRRMPPGTYVAGAASQALPDDLAQSFKGPWTAVDAARAVLLLTRADAVAPEPFFEAAVTCYEQGDAGEQRSWLRAVALLPEPHRFLAIVIDACRTNIVPNFEAVACENPYPTRHFPDGNFNQLVMKAMFNGIRLERIMGLSARTNPELARMAADFAAERRAAGRPVPIDIGMALAGAEQRGLTR
jgi:hypothetical protein